MTGPLMKLGRLALFSLLQKARTPLGVAGVLVSVELIWSFFPTWLMLFGFPLNPLGLQSYEALMLIFCFFATITLAAVTLGQQARRIPFVRRAPCKDVFYGPVRLLANAFWGVTVIPAILLGAFFVPIFCRILLHSTAFLFLVFYNFELSELRETSICELALGFPKNSAERLAILISSRFWTSLVAQILLVEVGVLVLWKVFKNLDVALAVGMSPLVIVMPIWGGIFWSSAKMVRRIKMDLAYQEKKEQEEAVARKGTQEKRHDP